jgi:AhpD family alkylhydroperoxidase
MAHYRTATVNGRKIFYREAGDNKAPTLVLLHGFPSSSHMFRDLIPLLAGRFHVIAPDLIGFGYSEAPSLGEFDYSFENLANATQDLLDQLGIKNYGLYMQDYGGPIGLRLATMHPERITGLVIQNANAYMEGVGKPVADVFLPLWKERNCETEKAARGFLAAETTKFQYTAGTLNPDGLNPDAWTHDQARLDRFGNADIQLELFADYQNNVALYDVWHAYFRRHQPPTLVVWGKNDPLFVAEGAEAYRKDLPDAEIHLLDAGHFALETHAPEIATAICNFFARIMPKTRSPGSVAESLFGGLTQATAPAAAQPLLAKTNELFGFTPNLAVAMSADPAALEGYLHALLAFGHTTLNPIEQQIVLMAVSRANEAEYSVAVHATLAAKLGAASDVIQAVATGRPVAEPRFAALQRFAEVLTVGRGQVTDYEIERFLAVGYDRAAIIAVAFGVAIKSFANGVAHLTLPRIDAGFAPALAGLRG